MANLIKEEKVRSMIRKMKIKKVIMYTLNKTIGRPTNNIQIDKFKVDKIYDRVRM